MAVPASQLVNARTAARFLGIDQPALRERARRRTIPSRRIKGRVLFDLESLRRWQLRRRPALLRALGRAAAVRARPEPIEPDDPVSTRTVARDQKLDCARRALCLDVASLSGWAGWRCSNCPGYVPQSREQRDEEVVGLVLLARLVTASDTDLVRIGVNPRTGARLANASESKRRRT